MSGFTSVIAPVRKVHFHWSWLTNSLKLLIVLSLRLSSRCMLAVVQLTAAVWDNVRGWVGSNHVSHGRGAGGLINHFTVFYNRSSFSFVIMIWYLGICTGWFWLLDYWGGGGKNVYMPLSHISSGLIFDSLTCLSWNSTIQLDTIRYSKKYLFILSETHERQISLMGQ